MAKRDADCSARVMAINVNECRDLMMACMMARLASLGWSEGEARMVCDKAIDRMVDAMPARMERMARVCGNAAADDAPDVVLKMIASAEFAIGGVEIADDLHKSKIAACN
jgi:hypothetical protein